MRTLLLLCLVLALAAAGCSAPPKGATPSASTTTHATVPAGSTLHAPAARAVTSTAIAFDGQTYTGACAFAATVGTCEFPDSPGLGHDTFKQLDAPGSAKALHLNVTWSATVPAQPELQVYLVHKENDVWYWRTGNSVASGPSPLRIDWPLNGTASDYAVSVVQETYGGAGSAGAAADTPQDFHAAGTIVSET